MNEFLILKTHLLSNHYGFSDRQSHVNADKPLKNSWKCLGHEINNLLAGLHRGLTGGHKNAVNGHKIGYVC